MMKQLIREYFTFNKRERNGIFVLLSIIMLLIIYLTVSDRFIQTESVDFSKFEKEIQALNSLEQKERQTNLQHINQEEHLPLENDSVAVEHFPFNPNNLSDKNWKKLGLNDKQIRAIKKYESKGGRFWKKEDVKKMIVISPELYASLEPYILIPEEKKKFSESLIPKKESREITILELNAADSSQLDAIKGIGPFYAKNIIKYRNLLGGYYSKAQLMEVWKFDKETYEVAEKYFTVDVAKIKKININTCTAKELKHPYINWKTANAIINYRMKHGNYSTMEEIKKTDLIDQETFLKMAPYLKVGN